MKFSGLVKFFLCFVMAFFSVEALADETPPTNPPAQNPPAPPKSDSQPPATTKREEELLAEIARLKGEKAGGRNEDDPLILKTRQDKDDKDKRASETREVERALKFNLTVDEFVKTNKSFLPEEIDGILSQASRERYDTEFEKAGALKASIIKSYFSVQQNLDSLTPSQKKAVEDWNRLTASGRQDKAADLYDNVFEPCIDTQRRIKRAEDVGRARAGLADSSQGKAYKDKLIKISREAHLREKA